MPRSTLQKSVLFSGILTLAIFIVELITPRGVSESTLYVVVVLASLWSGDRRVVYSALILCTFLTILGLFLSSESLDFWKAIANRTFAIIAFWSVGLLGMRYLQTGEKLRALNIELEERITERTARLKTSLDFIDSHYQILQTVISFENLEDVLKSMVETVARILSADRATIITFDHESQQVTQLVGAGPGVKDIIQSVSYDELMEGLSGWAISNLQPAFSPKGQPDPRESPAVQKRRAETNCGCIVVLPLMHMGETLGTLTVINTPQQPDFTESQVKLAETIANQSASAIGRTQIYEQLKQANLLLEGQSERLQQELIDRKHVEAVLASERDLLQALMDNIPDTIYFKDTASRFTRVNAAQAKVLGVAAAEDAIGKTDLDFFQDSELARGFYKEEQRIFTTGEPVINRPEFNPTPDGRPRWFSATKVPIRNSEGHVTGLVGVSRDITKIKQVEEALRQSEERFRLVTWATTDVVWDLDLETDQILWGPGLQKVFKYESEIVQTYQKWWLDHIHEEDRAKVDHSFRQALDTGMEFWSKEYRFLRADGTYADVIDRGYILREDNGRPYRVIGSIMDITERRQAEETIRRQNEMLSSLHQITLDLLKVREIDPLLNTLVDLASSFLDAPNAEIMLVEGENLVVYAASQNQSHLLGERVGRQEAILSWQAADTRKPVVLDDYSNWPHRRDVYSKFSLHAVAEFPILDDQQCLGVLSFGRDKPDYEFDNDQIQFGLLFANLTALVLNNAQLRETLREQSIRDPLTGLYNRRYMEETLNREITRATRHSHPLGIIMIDIDHFKRFNDSFGHVIGDKLLRAVGGFLQGLVRGEDIACRYGGEEFILIMPDTKQETVRQRAEQLRLGAGNININTNSLAFSEITISLGVAIYPQHGGSIEEIIDAADAALYRAKQGGRNQVAVAVKP